jgi:hydroxymethylcytosylglucuronate/cytosylglucuronate synthase
VAEPTAVRPHHPSTPRAATNPPRTFGPPAVAICGVDFGWGSAGKLHAVLDALASQSSDRPRLVGLGTRLGRPLLADLPVETWYDRWPDDPRGLRALLHAHGVTAGLVVLEPAVAESLEEAGCPTVFVDSLPYLWTDRDPVPTGFTRYCAQLCGSLPRPSWGPLRSISRLSWVKALVDGGGRHRPAERGLALLNLGGLHSPLNVGGTDAYLHAVLGPALRALAAAGFTNVEVCGNVPASDTVRTPPGGSGMTVHARPRPNHEFLALLDRAELLVTSPGLTTLLEAAAREVPTVLLPPQNVSQILNADQFAAYMAPECRVRWPDGVLDPAAVEAARPDGEEAALAVVYAAVEHAAAHPERVSAPLRQDLAAAIAHARHQPTGWDGLIRAAGSRGADQVAEAVHQVLTSAEGAGR